MKKFIFTIPLLIWVSLGFFDILYYFLKEQKPMYFRAWEFALNEGKNSYYSPFKPFVNYYGVMSGDLLNYAQFTPHKNEIRNQVFITDEYGFRNRPNFLDDEVRAVIVGTSFVGGAQETQEELISEILTTKHGIKTYNYATLPLQHFFEDKRFINMNIKYLIIVGNESEILTNNWIEVLKKTNTTHDVEKWKSLKEWEDENLEIDNFNDIEKQTTRFSIVRYLLKESKKQILNNLFDRQSIISLYKNPEIEYDKKRNIIFSDYGYDPTFNKSSKDMISQTIQTIKNTKEVLSERNIKLILVVVPSKSHLHSEKYRGLIDGKSTVDILQKNLANNNIWFIDVKSKMDKILKDNPSVLFYYPDDGHWNTITNRLIAENLAESINNLSNQDN